MDASPDVDGEEATELVLDIFEEAEESAAKRLLIVWLFPPSFNATDFDLLFIIIAAAVAAVLLFSKIWLRLDTTGLFSIGGWFSPPFIVGVDFDEGDEVWMALD